MMKLRWAILFTALTVFLTACPGPAPVPGTAKLTLAATPNPVPTAGAPVKLDATITEGAANVASVDFAVKDATTALGTDSDAANGFSFTTATPITAATTFVATARNAANEAIGSAEVAVTVTAGPPPGSSVAPSKTIITVSGIPTVSGKAATGLQAVAAEVTGVQGTTTPEASKATSKGTVVIETSAANKLQFTYTPSATATGTDTFQYTVKNGTAAPATGTITLNLAKKVLAPVAATTLTDINSAVANEVVVITGTGDITCAVDPCVNLEAGQVLLGNGAGKIGDVTVTNSAAKRTIVANPAVGNLATVIKLANDVTVQGINISSGANNAGNNIFRAVTDFGGPLVTGAITLKDIDINMGASTAGAIDIGTEVAADRANTIVLDDVTIAGLNNGAPGISINSAGSVSIINVAPTVTVAYDAANTAGTGVSIVGVNTTVVLDGAAVTSAAVDNDADATNAPPSPAFTINKTGAGTMSLTVKNTRTTVGAAVAPNGPGTAFHLTGNGAGTMAVQAGSTGNSVTPATATRVVKSGTVALTGTIAP
jgi:hypothetical protein